MKKTLTIGRSPQNDIVLNIPDISGTHAKITDLGNGEYKVEDLDSSNGVYVNGYRIKTSNVSLDDQVRLSANQVLDLAVLFGKKQGPVIPQGNLGGGTSPLGGKTQEDYSEEFLRLKKVYDDYTRKKKKIIEGNQRKQVLMRMGFMAIPMILQHFLGTIVAGASILMAGLAQLMPGGTKYMDKLEELNDNFMIRFICPNKKCNQKLYGRSWTVWYDEGRCPKCNSKFKK